MMLLTLFISVYHIFISNNVTSILPIHKHRSATAISAHRQISGQNSDNMIHVSSLFINITMHAFFHIRTVIITQPISITHSLVCV